MYGVDMTKPGAQAYYDSVFALLAAWGVDFVKVDDISRPYHDHEREIEAIRRAIDRTGRPMVLSLSPGETALTAAEHVRRHANLWRISDDFWDNWPALLEQFGAARALEPAPRPGALARRRHAAARRAGAGPPHDALHARRAAHADDAVVDRPLAADPRRRHDEDRRGDARAAHERRGHRRQPGEHRQPAAVRPRRARRVDGVGARLAPIAISRSSTPATASRSTCRTPVFTSPLVTRATPGRGVPVDVDVAGKARLVLVADGGRTAPAGTTRSGSSPAS